MSTALAAMPRAPKRNDVVVKMDAEVYRMARIAAAYEDIPIAELISETLRPVLEQKLREHSAEHGKPKRRSD